MHLPRFLRLLQTRLNIDGILNASLVLSLYIEPAPRTARAIADEIVGPDERIDSIRVTLYRLLDKGMVTTTRRPDWRYSDGIGTKDLWSLTPKGRGVLNRCRRDATLSTAA